MENNNDTDAAERVSQLVEEAGLHYTTDLQKGYWRERKEQQFEYYNTQGKIITDEKTLNRIRSLVLPPAWEQVWICPDPKGHLQATGIDSKGRKQYRYHPGWTKMRKENKFGKMQAFGKALPLIRHQVQEDLNACRSFCRDKVVAAVVGLLDHTLIRIGNKEYEKTNHSYGLTTLRNKHMKLIGRQVIFEFVGKKGVKQSIQVTDSQLARLVKKCRELPGHRLFQYYDEQGNKKEVSSNDVNDYLKSVTGESFTAKDFRTWGGSAYAVKLIAERKERPQTEAALKKTVNEIIGEVARKLGNTVSVCRSHYLHPLVIEAYQNDFIRRLIDKYPDIFLTNEQGLRPEEKLFLKILEEVIEDIEEA